MSSLLPPHDRRLRISGHFAGELHHLALELGRILRTFEDARFGADNQARRGALPRPDHVIGQALESPGVFRANVRDHQVTLVLDLWVRVGEGDGVGDVCVMSF